MRSTKWRNTWKNCYAEISTVLTLQILSSLVLPFLDLERYYVNTGDLHQIVEEIINLMQIYQGDELRFHID